MYWQLRFLRNSLLAATPGYQRIRLAKRKFIPYDGAVDPWTVEQGLRIVEMLRTSGTRIEGATALELGSGWRPVIPLILRAAGARRVYMVDAEQLLDERLLSDTARHLREKAPMLSQRLQVPVESIRATLSSVEGAGLEKATNALGLVYLAPADARRLALEPGDVDIVSSRAVLEHIPREVLEAIFAEFARILVPGRGVMCHIVDNSDHWAHIDKRLSMVNFLAINGQLSEVLRAPLEAVRGESARLHESPAPQRVSGFGQGDRIRCASGPFQARSRGAGCCRETANLRRLCCVQLARLGDTHV